MDNYLLTARSAAEKAVTVLRTKYLTDAKITDNTGKDIKTEADKYAQKVIVEELRSTGIPILAEESGGSKDKLLLETPQLNGKMWVVDPLDGTVNFWRGFPMAAVSIALWDSGEPLVGVVSEVYHDIVFTAKVGEGAWCNDNPIQVSTTGSIKNAVIATGFPSGRSYDTESLTKFLSTVQSYKKVRMLGTAALSLAHVATGHFDVYSEEDIYIWDVAAGLALVRAAGGRFLMEKGSDDLKFHVVASNGLI